MRIEGAALVLGDHVNTDLLHPPAFFDTDAKAAARGAFAGLDIDREALGKPPYIVVAGENFGCGSSRESTVSALKQVGLTAVVARSFSHIFSRNAVNAGIRVFRTEQDLRPVATGMRVLLETEGATLETPEGVFALVAPDQLERQIAKVGGLEAYLSARDWKW